MASLPELLGVLLIACGSGLCLDTGHLMVGAGDPVGLLGRWAARINHVHLKDVRRGLLQQIVSEGAPADEIWLRDVFCTLGEGGLDVDGVLDGLRSTGYTGWLVVEQDVFTDDKPRFERAVTEQRVNRRYLQQRGL